MTDHHQNSLLTSGMLLLGSYAFGSNASTALHELGHAIAMWLLGGQVERITLHPFSWSYTYYANPSPNPLLTNWGGAAFSVLVGCLLLAFLWHRRSSYLAPLLMIGVSTLLNNGAYFITDTLFDHGGDASDLIQLGVSPAVTYAAGAVALVLALQIGALLLPRLGIAANTSLGGRLLVLGLGVLPYLSAMEIYDLLFSPGRGIAGPVYLVAGALGVGLVALLSKLYCLPGIVRPGACEPVDVSRRAVVLALVLGIAVVTIELIIF